MIKKDAIEILKSIQDNLEETRFLERCAIDMAIEALKHVQELEYMIIPNEAIQEMRDVLYYEKGKADARPHGEWIDESKDALKCSACGKWVYKPFIGGFPTERTQHYKPNYCAFCGADMREGEENE